MESKEKIEQKIKKLNTILETFMKENMPKNLNCTDNITGVIIMRFEKEAGIHTSCIGYINFKEAALAMLDFDSHSQQYKIPVGDNIAA